MQQYITLANKILQSGTTRSDRTGVGTIGLFGETMRFDLSEGFPLVTTKRVFMRGIIEELLWILRGESNITSLVNNRVHIWDGWATEDGELGPVYGVQWRSWPSQEVGSPPIDQIKELIEGLRKKPFSRRHIVTAWNPSCLPDESIAPHENAALGKMALPPCHCLFQFHVSQVLEGGQVQLNAQTGEPILKLSCQLYQRSVDVMLGLPFNIASYALLTMMVAQCVGMVPGEFIHVSGDCHIYLNHVETFKAEQQNKKPMPLPTMLINPHITDIDKFSLSDFHLSNYVSGAPVNYPVAI